MDFFFFSKIWGFFKNIFVFFKLQEFLCFRTFVDILKICSQKFFDILKIFFNNCNFKNRFLIRGFKDILFNSWVYMFFSFFFKNSWIFYNYFLIQRFLCFFSKNRDFLKLFFRFARFFKFINFLKIFSQHLMFILKLLKTISCFFLILKYFSISFIYIFFKNSCIFIFVFFFLVAF